MHKGCGRELGGVFPEVCFLENNCYSHTLHTDSMCEVGRGLQITYFRVLEDGGFFLKCEFTMSHCCSQRLGVNLEDTSPCPCVGFSLMSGFPSVAKP